MLYTLAHFIKKEWEMAGNTFGRILKLTTFGESHGTAIGGVLDGCPAGLPLNEEDIQAELDRRKPGTGNTATARKESDKIILLSGIFEGRTTGTPIGFYIANENARSGDYSSLAKCFRPGHADWPYYSKYRGIRDFRGGGRASGRETACRVVGGAIAKKILELSAGVRIYAACVEFGGLPVPEGQIDFINAASRSYFAASDAIIEKWDTLVCEARERKDTLGGIVSIKAVNVPPGLGEPVFDRLDATLAHAIMSVGAVKGVEIGSGFQAARLCGSSNNDPLFPGQTPAQPLFGSNNSGGVLGGISSGQDIMIKAAVKPIASIPQEQKTITVDGEPTTITIAGRHDLSAIPRIVPVLSAMTALAIADAFLLQTRMGIFDNGES